MAMSSRFLRTSVSAEQDGLQLAELLVEGLLLVEQVQVEGDEAVAEVRVLDLRHLDGLGRVNGGTQLDFLHTVANW